MRCHPLRLAWVLLIPSSCSPYTHCDVQSEVRGTLLCAHTVRTRELWDALSIPLSRVDRRREGKYLVPGRLGSRMDPVVVNANEYALHSDFIDDVYAHRFGSMTLRRYSDMVLDHENDEFFSGDLLELIDTDGTTAWGFTVWDNAALEQATVTEAEVRRVQDHLARMFRLGTPRFVPQTQNQRDAADTWSQLAVWPPTDTRSEAYTAGEAYGFVKRYALGDLAPATSSAAYGYRDLLVLDETPMDVARVVAGVVTGARQGALSHVNVRSAARGTVNCYIDDAMEVFAAWDGQLVHFTCTDDDWSIEAAHPEEAEAWWASQRPVPAVIPTPHTGSAPVVPLDMLPTATATERDHALRRYGAKATNLAAAYRHTPTALHLQGLVIPFAAYTDFMETNGWNRDLGEGLAWYSFADTLRAWLDSPQFHIDPLSRATKLADLRQTMQHSSVSPYWLESIATEIETIWPDDTTMIRARSSSNAEDALTFSGAGLYTSTNVCLADMRDEDNRGPSRCDSDIAGERTLERALTHVWSSLWNIAAYEERDWYGIDHDQVAMAVLFNTRHADELANVVAFDGGLTPHDDRQLVQAQLGDLEVVAADPGVVPEVWRLEIDEGRVVDIERVQSSSETEAIIVPEGTLRMIGEQLASLGQDMAWLKSNEKGVEVRLDTEWKINRLGELKLKQLRPFPLQPASP